MARRPARGEVLPVGTALHFRPVRRSRASSGGLGAVNVMTVLLDRTMDIFKKKLSRCCTLGQSLLYIYFIQVVEDRLPNK
jgi:hypothetical protein